MAIRTGATSPPVGQADEALRELVTTLHDGQRLIERTLVRAEQVQALREQGRSYRGIVFDGAERERLLIVSRLLSEGLAPLVEAGARWRRAEAQALYAEGVTMDRIAGLFDVTRQRISELLRGTDVRRGVRAATGPEAGHRGRL